MENGAHALKEKNISASNQAVIRAVSNKLSDLRLSYRTGLLGIDAGNLSDRP